MLCAINSAPAAVSSRDAAITPKVWATDAAIPGSEARATPKLSRHQYSAEVRSEKTQARVPR